VRHQPEKAKGGRRGADMSTLTLEPTCGEDVDRSVAAGAAARREAAGPQVGRAVDPEVAAVARRRKFSDQYKLRILAEIEANPGSTGAIIRREGLYSSHITDWRRWRDGVTMEKKPTSKNKQMHNEMAKLQRENSRLTMKLKKAETLIDLQKKTSELLEMMSLSVSDEK
jgi:transposase